VGYCAKFFPGLLGTAVANVTGIHLTLGLVAIAAVGFALDSAVLAGSATSIAVALALWSLRVFHPKKGNPKTTGVYRRYPQFARLAYVWLAVSAVLGFGVSQPGMLGASRHAFTVGFLATLIFSIGPRILPSFLKRIMERTTDAVLTCAGYCGLRVAGHLRTLGLWRHCRLGMDGSSRFGLLRVGGRPVMRVQSCD